MNNNNENVLESLVRVLSLYSICIGLHVSKQELLRGGSRIFLGGAALVSCSTSTPIDHIDFFSQNTSCIRKPQVISGRGGVRTPCTLPLDPPLLLFQAINLHVANRSAVQVKCKSRLKFWEQVVFSEKFKDYIGLYEGLYRSIVVSFFSFIRFIHRRNFGLFPKWVVRKYTRVKALVDNITYHIWNVSLNAWKP